MCTICGWELWSVFVLPSFFWREVPLILSPQKHQELSVCKIMSFLTFANTYTYFQPESRLKSPTNVKSIEVCLEARMYWQPPETYSIIFNFNVSHLFTPEQTLRQLMKSPTEPTDSKTRQTQLKRGLQRLFLPCRLFCPLVVYLASARNRIPFSWLETQKRKAFSPFLLVHWGDISQSIFPAVALIESHGSLVHGICLGNNCRGLCCSRMDISPTDLLNCFVFVMCTFVDSCGQEKCEP